MKAKVKRLEINPESLLRIMQDDSAWRVTRGVPKTAKLRGLTIDPYTQVIHLFVEDESFPAVDINELIPKMDSYFKRLS